MNECYKCKTNKMSSEMFLLNFRKLGIYASHGVKVGYSRYYCDDCLKEFDMYEVIESTVSTGLSSEERKE